MDNRPPMDFDRKSMSTSVTSPTRMSTSCAGAPLAMDSKITGGVPEPGHHSYSGDMNVSQCDKCGREHHRESKLGQQGCYIYG